MKYVFFRNFCTKTCNFRTILEIDGPTHFYYKTKIYNSNTLNKHRILTNMGYRVLHIPYFEWNNLENHEKNEYLKNKLNEEPDEWLNNVEKPKQKHIEGFLELEKIHKNI
eukprot:GHVL01003413.1.p1 GENE.GHVL01003413.1~~GHVL01003413.1.p1  ORF type:complete len:110 (+),score=30.71 GHVL01003413.1:5-334(+)